MVAKASRLLEGVQARQSAVHRTQSRDPAEEAHRTTLSATCCKDGWGVDAEATRQATRGAQRTVEPLWRIKAREDGRLHRDSAECVNGLQPTKSRVSAIEAWQQIAGALSESGSQADGRLARSIARFVSEGTPSHVRRQFDHGRLVDSSPER